MHLFFFPLHLRKSLVSFYKFKQVHLLRLCRAVLSFPLLWFSCPHLQDVNWSPKTSTSPLFGCVGLKSYVYISICKVPLILYWVIYSWLLCLFLRLCLWLFSRLSQRPICSSPWASWWLSVCSTYPAWASASWWLTDSRAWRYEGKSVNCLSTRDKRRLSSSQTCVAKCDVVSRSNYLFILRWLGDIFFYWKIALDIL